MSFTYFNITEHLYFKRTGYKKTYSVAEVALRFKHSVLEVRYHRPARKTDTRIQIYSWESKVRIAYCLAHKRLLSETVN